MKMQCIRPCWDSRIPRYYWMGEEADINPKDPIAKHFTPLEPVPRKVAPVVQEVAEPEERKEEFEPIRPPEPKGRVGKRPARK